MYGSAVFMPLASGRYLGSPMSGLSQITRRARRRIASKAVSRASVSAPVEPVAEDQDRCISRHGLAQVIIGKIRETFADSGAAGPVLDVAGEPPQRGRHIARGDPRGEPGQRRVEGEGLGPARDFCPATARMSTGSANRDPSSRWCRRGRPGGATRPPARAAPSRSARLHGRGSAGSCGAGRRRDRAATVPACGSSAWRACAPPACQQALHLDELLLGAGLEGLGP